MAKHNSLRPKLVIGFAAETSNLVENSKNKLIEKNCDWIIANDVSNKSIGFNSDFNEVTIFHKDKKINDEIPWAITGSDTISHKDIKDYCNTGEVINK